MVGSYIHHKLGFSHETPVFNIQEACASFIDGCERRPNRELADQVREEVVHLYEIGDCLKPRDIMHAVHEGAWIAISI